MKTVVLEDRVEAFVKAFKAIGAGDLAEQVADDMLVGIKATMSENKKSTITIKLEITKQSDEMVAVAGLSSVSTPKPKPQSSFFIDGMTHMITRERPNQQVMSFERGENA